MDISGYTSGITANIVNQTAPFSISTSTVGNALINLANLTKTSVEQKLDITGLSGITKTNVTTALGYTPASASTTLNNYGIASGDTLFDGKYFPTSSGQTINTLANTVSNNLNQLITTSGGTNTDITGTLINGYVMADGTFTASANWRTADKRLVNPGDIIAYNGVRPYVIGSAAIIGYDAAQANPRILLSGTSTDLGQYNTAVTIPTGVTYITASSRFVNPDVFTLGNTPANVPYVAISKVLSLQGSLNSKVDTSYLFSGSQPQYVVTATISGNFAPGGSNFPTSASAVNSHTNPISCTIGDAFAIEGLVDSPALNSNFGQIFNAAGTPIYTILYTDLSNITGGRKLVIPSTTGGTPAYFGANIRNTDLPNFKIQKGATVQKVVISNTVLPSTYFDSTIKLSTGITWNAIGDSITFWDAQPYPAASGSISGQTAIGYQTLIKQRISFGGYNNYGYPGYPLVQYGGSGIIEQRTGWTTGGLYTLLAGTNDFRLDRPLGAQSDYTGNTGAGTFYGALRVFVDYVYSANTSASILFITPMQRNNGGYTSLTVNGAGFYLADYVNAIRWVADRNSLPVADLNKYVGINLSNLNQYLYDGLHPNNSGYQLMAKSIIEKLLVML